MLEILIEKKLLFPLILFVAVYAAIEISYYRGHAAGTAEEKERQEKVIQELKDKTISEYLILEKKQNRTVADYQKKIQNMEKDYDEIIKALENNEIKIKNSLSVAANDLSECLQRKSGKVSSAVSKTTDQSDFECFRKSDISRRIERTLAVGMKCDKLAEKYNSLLKVCSEF